MSEQATLEQPSVPWNQVSPGSIGQVVGGPHNGQDFFAAFGGFTLVDDLNDRSLDDNKTQYTYILAGSGWKLRKNL